MTLEAAGLSGADVAAWRSATPTTLGSFPAAARATCDFLMRGEELLGRLPEAAERTDVEGAAADELIAFLNGARADFMRAYAADVYGALTDDLRIPARVEDLVYAAADLYPGLCPTRSAMELERARKLSDKQGIEVAQGLFLAHVLAESRSGAHLVWSMLRPTEAALERLDDFRSTGVADLDGAYVEKRGRAAHLELRNPRHLNAEDLNTLPDTEVAVDLVLLDPDVEVGVFRGGVVEHPRYAGGRIFGAGINLTLLYQGQIDFLFYITRDMGYVNKLYRGLSSEEHRPGEPEDTTEKLWVAAVETYAIGGACQLLHTMDHVIATRGCRLYLPARKEGIIPGASNMRLARSVGDRLARQAILSGLEFEAGTPEGDLLCDETIDDAADMDGAVEARVEALTSSGLINAAANRRAMRVGAEPLEMFREYMAMYCREQAYCHLSPALVHNLEVNWNAHERSV
ncbi:MAG TPA: enoyl-CoA hydratase/isomerase family protein [Thermoleophilaceae bacterium]